MTNQPDRELEGLREEAIKEGWYFGVSRLREQFKVKPRPDAQPVKWVTSPYKRGKNPLYLVKDCVPLKTQTKAVASPSQLISREISGLKAKLRSNSCTTSLKIKEFLIHHPDAVILDVETTGLSNSDQIIEMAIVDIAGTPLINQRFRPTVKITPGASEVHGMTMETLTHEPCFGSYSEQVREILTKHPVIIFNKEFDLRMLKNSLSAYDIDHNWVDGIKPLCAMRHAAKVYGANNRYGSISLSDAVCVAQITWQGDAHSALADCLTTLQLLHAMADYAQPLMKRLDELEIKKSLLISK